MSDVLSTGQARKLVSLSLEVELPGESAMTSLALGLTHPDVTLGRLVEFVGTLLNVNCGSSYRMILARPLAIVKSGSLLSEYTTKVYICLDKQGTPWIATGKVPVRE